VVLALVVALVVIDFFVVTHPPVGHFIVLLHSQRYHYILYRVH